MFNLVQKETFKQKVTLQVKTDNGWREEHFVGVFQRTPQSRQQELQAMPFGEVIDEVLVGWDMKDMQSQPVEFTSEHVAALKEVPGAARETVLAYLAANAGAKQKN